MKLGVSEYNAAITAYCKIILVYVSMLFGTSCTK